MQLFFNIPYINLKPIVLHLVYLILKMGKVSRDPRDKEVSLFLLFQLLFIVVNIIEYYLYTVLLSVIRHY